MGKYLIGIVLIIIATAVGFFIGVSGSKSGVNLPLLTGKVSKNPLFKSQTATFQGIITKVNGTSSLSVKDESGNTGTFPVASRVAIYKLTGASRQASASSDLKIVETDKRVLIVLELKENQYQVISISYLPPAPSKR